MSESISSGYMPWWNPYVNFGIPQYADMSCSFWSPITWIIASTVGYNVYTITIELLFYILMAGWGMYKCGDIFNWNKNARIVVAAAFMCSGFITGHLQHLNWISGAAFLPWCLWAYENLLKSKSLKNLLLAVFFFYILISSSHPGIIIGSIYFFIFYTVYIFYLSGKQNHLSYVSIFLKRVLPFIVLLIIVSSAMIYSYIEILPYISRGDKVFVNIPAQNSTTINNWISFLFPLATVNNNSEFFINEPTLRNCYFGIIVFLFGLSSLTKNWKKNFFFLLTGLFFMLVSANGFFQSICYKFLPLLGYVRLNGEFRLFALLSFIIISGNAISDYLKSGVQSKYLSVITKSLVYIFVGALVLSSYNVFFSGKSFLFRAASDSNIISPVIQLKRVLSSLTLSDLILIQSVITIPLLIAFYKALQKNLSYSIILLITLDLLISTIIQIPFTGAGIKSTKEIQSYLNKTPKGVPIPKLDPLILNDTGVAGIDKILGKWSLYNKQPGNLSQASYPTVFKTESIIYTNEMMNAIKEKPFLFFNTSDTLNLQKNDSPKIEEITIKKFTPNEIILNLKTESPGELFLLYKNYKHWNATVNSKNYTLESYKNAFYKLPIANNANIKVYFWFNPEPIKISALITLTSFLIMTMLLLIYFLIKRLHR